MGDIVKMYNKEYRKLYNERNRERILRQRKAWRERNKDKTRAYYLQHKEKMLAQHKDWIGENREKQRIYNKSYSQRQKGKLLTHYGGGKLACIRCGESRLDCLSIDHIEDNGAEDRKRFGVWSGNKLYRYLIREGFPEGYQTLCMNCQFIKELTKRRLGKQRRKVMEKIITDNTEETIRINWDGTRFALTSERKGNDVGYARAVTILNPREMMDIIRFASSIGGK